MLASASNGDAFGVLLVEDDPMVRVAVDLVFSDDPRFEIRGTAVSADEALRLARTAGDGIDLIVLDDRLLGPRSGLEVAPDLKKACPRSRTILFSATAGADAAASPGVDASVAKSDPNLLLTTGRRLLDARDEIDLRDGSGPTEAGTPFATEAGTPFATEAGTPFATEAGTLFATEAGTPLATEAGTPFSAPPVELARAPRARRARQEHRLWAPPPGWALLAAAFALVLAVGGGFTPAGQRLVNRVRGIVSTPEADPGVDRPAHGPAPTETVTTVGPAATVDAGDGLPAGAATAATAATAVTAVTAVTGVPASLDKLNDARVAAGIAGLSWNGRLAAAALDRATAVAAGGVVTARTPEELTASVPAAWTAVAEVVGAGSPVGDPMESLLGLPGDAAILLDPAYDRAGVGVASARGLRVVIVLLHDLDPAPGGSRSPRRPADPGDVEVGPRRPDPAVTTTRHDPPGRGPSGDGAKPSGAR